VGDLAEFGSSGGQRLSHPLVTVGVTAFNAADTIERAVRSALAQTWRPIEVLVVDDGSTDHTKDVLERLASQHPEMLVLYNKINGGVAVARNRLVAEAKGEFLAFFDDDDESAPDRIEVQLQRIVKYEQDFANGAPVVCHTARRLLYPDGREQIAPTMGQSEGQAPAGLSVAERVLLGTPLDERYGACPTCSQMARLSTFHALGGFDPAFRRGEDTDFTIRLAKAGGHFVGIAKPLVVQTMTKSEDKSLTDEWQIMSMLLEKHRDVPERLGLYSFCLRWVDAKQAWLEGRRASFAIRLIPLLLTHPARTIRRLVLALPNIKLNRAFKRFHTR